MMLRSSLILLGMLAGASPARGQDPRLSAHFTAPVAARFNAVIDSATHEGLPADPLILRALEGQAKGASTDQIAAALVRLHDALRTAHRLLDADASASDLTTGAAALQAGVLPARISELHQLRGSRGIAAPMGAYLDLLARGASADRAWIRITDLARGRATDADFVRLTPQDLDRDPRDKPAGGPDEEPA